MKHDTNTRFPDSNLRRIKLLGLLLAVVGVLATNTHSDANQVFKPCGKKWLNQVKKLPAEQLSWMLEERSTEVVKDLDGDGAIDTLTMTNRPSYRSCDLRTSWDKKETTIRIEYGNGKTKMLYWIDRQLVEQMRFYTGLGRFLVVGVDAQGEGISRWVEYDQPSEAPMLQETLQVAGLE